MEKAMYFMEKRGLIENFNSSDDYQVFNILTGSKTTTLEKKYLIDNCRERLIKMDANLFMQMLQIVDEEFCTVCSDFLENVISSLSIEQIESLLYSNKHYHYISPISNFLMEKDWFKRQYQIFALAYELEQIRENEKIDESLVEDLGIKIINALTEEHTNAELFDMLIKNYLTILEKHNKGFLEQFKGYGYEIMDKCLAQQQKITSNLLIFDCEIMRLTNATNIDHFEFYNSTNDSENKAFAYAHAGTVRINTDAIEDIYAEYQNRNVATQIIFYVIGHEIDHVFCERYRSSESRDSHTELKVYNSGISSALQDVTSREFYREYHNCFTHEYQANIAGIESLYMRYKYLKSIGDEDKIEVNKLLAGVLLSSFCRVESPDRIGYFGPVEFTRDEFLKYKDDLPGYAYYSLLNKQVDMPEELEVLEENLSELERLLFGYYNRYIGIIALIAKGELESKNIFEDIEDLYDKNKDAVKETYPSFNKENGQVKK